ncbi:hypothetical protein K457DRAFT_26988 [Linnemannia elongata AG-77]|uniref:F-box domain-containing protein n=1 Tax=Linnemannia elongata AG-77 TaxID=1314771 RepID=A0A197KGV2_9FUNG|nr:hypothetical protein K457DRAFT_26988 [Linnemannia elongata AG-77]
MSKSPPPAIHHPSRKRPSLIDIPEILERIFYFTDDFTLRRTAVLVCRHWLHMNINRIPRTVYYKNELRMRLRQPELVVSRLTGATRLCCYHTVDEVSRDVKNPFKSNIRDVIVDSQVEYRKQLETRNQTPTHKHKPAIHSFSPLRKMDIEIVQYISGSFDTFPFPETFTNVTLHIHSSRNASFNFNRILHRGPLLEMLSIETIRCDYNCLTWEDEPMTPHRDLALRSLTLNQITLQHSMLAHILSSAPQLKDTNTGSSTTSARDMSHHFRMDLIGIRLSSLLLKELEVHTPCLTTLELHWQRKGRVAAYEGCRNDIVTASRLLFEYLCNSPSAANLKSLKTGVLFQNMDVFGRGQPFDASFSPALQTPSNSPGIWRCPPILEDLEIYFPCVIINKAPEHIYAARLCMQLEGGFCLLSRLRSLQRLRVYAAGRRGITGLCQEMDLNWIVPSGRSDKFKELRQKEIASWQSL